MTNLWPWLAIAGVGALHGLSPATGWMFAAAWGLRTRDAAQVWRALMPIAVGYVASVAAVTWAVAQGVSMDRTWVRCAAGALLIAAASWRLLRSDAKSAPVCAPTAHAGIALWSFLMATAHGAGLILIPGLLPLCLTDNPAREITASGSLVLALAAVGVHAAAMLAVTGIIGTLVCRGVAMQSRWLDGTVPRHLWTAALGVTGTLLFALR